MNLTKKHKYLPLLGYKLIEYHIKSYKVLQIKYFVLFPTMTIHMYSIYFDNLIK